MRLKRQLKGFVFCVVFGCLFYLKFQNNIKKLIKNQIKTNELDKILKTEIMVEFKIEDIQVDFSNFIFRRDDYWKDINTTK